MAKKYFVEVKTGNRENCSPIMKTWHVNNLLKFVDFLDRDHPTWRYFNVMDQDTRSRLGSFTKNDRPVTRHL